MTLGIVLAALLAQAPSSPRSQRACATTPVKLLGEGPAPPYHYYPLPGDTGTTRLNVLINARGIVESVSVTKSSGSLGFDNDSVEIAVNSSYQPKTINCKAVSGVYQFSLSWVTNVVH